MKKIVFLFAVVLTSFMVTITSCKKTDNGEYTQLQVYYLGTYRDYGLNEAMKVYPVGNYAILQGSQTGTVNKMTIRIGGTTAGEYNISSTDTNSYIKIYKGYINYTTQRPGGWAKITVTQFGTDSVWTKGIFNGTVVNATSAADTLSFSQGVFNVKYTE